MAEETNHAHVLMTAKMLTARENHARLQQKDYSHVFRKKTFQEILRLSAFSFGIGFVYAAETAFVSPTLLQIGVDHSTMTLVWGISPILGLLFGPLLGSISDRCGHRLGRRRPIMLVLSLGIVIGCVLIPFGESIGGQFVDDETENAIGLSTQKSSNMKIIIFLTVLGTMLMDFNVETCQSPARAYMLDVCIPDDHNKVLTTFSTMTGLGSTIAYFIGGIDWNSTAIGQLFGGNIQTSFVIDAFFFVVCFCVTFFSFREIPLPLIERDKLLQPLTLATIKNESLTKNIANIGNNLVKDKNYNEDAVAKQINDINTGAEPVSLRRYLSNIIIMPKSMLLLSLTNLLCWMGHVCYCLYFTDFVGEEVFQGDPSSPVESQKYNLYMDGVRFGGLGMAIYALSCSVYSFAIQRLIIYFKIKNVYIFGILVFAIGMFILATWPNKIGVFLFSITAGIIFATTNTIPYIIVASYHAKACFEVCNGEYVKLKEPRGLGTDIAIINSMLFIAQLLISLSIGLIVSWMQTTKAVFYASSGFSTCAAVSAIFVLYI